MSVKGISGMAGIGGAIGGVVKPAPKPVEKRPEPQIAAKMAGNPSEAVAARAGMDTAQFQRLRLSTQAETKTETPKSTLQNLFELSGIGKPFMAPNSKEVAENVSNGLKVAYQQASSLFDTARTKAMEMVSDVKDVVTGKVTDVSTLKEDESIKIGGKGTISGKVVGGGLETAYEIKRGKDDPKTGEREYTVSVDANPLVKGGAGDFTGTLSGGAKMEYKFKSPEEVERFMKIHNRLAQAGGMRHGDDIISKEDSQFLNDHVSSIEFKKTVGVSYDKGIGIGKLGQYEISPEAKMQDGMKIEYKDGKPVALIRTTEVSINGSDKLGASLEKSGIKPFNSLGGKQNTGTEYKGTVTVETRIPLDQTKPLDVAELMVTPLTAAQKDKATNTIKIAVEKDDGKTGYQAEVEISDLSGKETRQIFQNLVSTKPDANKAFDGVKVDAKTKLSQFEDKGINSKIDLEYKNVGINYEVQVERRSVKVLQESENKDWGF